jgi:hypothetical protein
MSVLDMIALFTADPARATPNMVIEFAGLRFFNRPAVTIDLCLERYLTLSFERRLLLWRPP